MTGIVLLLSLWIVVEVEDLILDLIPDQDLAPGQTLDIQDLDPEERDHQVTLDIFVMDGIDLNPGPQKDITGRTAMIATDQMIRLLPALPPEIDRNLTGILINFMSISLINVITLYFS